MTETKDIKARIIEVLQTVFDPEIPVNIWELGLIYDINISNDDVIHITMTLTALGCPVADILISEVQYKLEIAIEEAVAVAVELVWDPPWTQDRMSEAAKLELGLC